MKNTYKNCEVTLKNLNFKVSLLDTEKEEYGEVELFKVEVTNILNGKSFLYRNFKNSVMEKKISDYLKEFSSQGIKNFKSFMNSQHWSGYDKIHYFQELDKKRVEYLLYSVIQDFSFYVNMSDYETTFENFCDNYGYERDSIKAFKIYQECLNFERKIKGLNLSEEQENFLINEVRSEEESFNEELKKELEKN